MSFIVTLIVSAAATVAICGVILSTLLAVKGLGHFGTILQQANEAGTEEAEKLYRSERHRQKAEGAPEIPADDPIYCGDLMLDRLAQYFDRP